MKIHLFFLHNLLHVALNKNPLQRHDRDNWKRIIDLQQQTDLQCLFEGASHLKFHQVNQRVDVHGVKMHRISILIHNFEEDLYWDQILLLYNYLKLGFWFSPLRQPLIPK